MRAHSVYVAVTDRREQTATYVACFDADTGQSRWVRYLGTASPEVNNPMGMGGMGMQGRFGTSRTWGDFNHRLLSLDGPALFYQTNLGCVVALEAETGATIWVATYPRQEPNHGGNGSERDLNPAVVHEGRVFVAPSDADALFAFDAANGRLLWKTARISDDVKLTHLLGVAKDRLVATGNRVLLFNVKTGRLLHAWPDSGKSLEGYGRGLLAGDLIYWPTQNEIQILDQRTGLRAEPPIKLVETYHTKGGNLVAGDGYLIVAQADGLVVFCQNSRLIERYREDIVRAPDRAANYFRLARAAEAIGRNELALDMYRQAAQKARSDFETVDPAFPWPSRGSAIHRFHDCWVSPWRARRGEPGAGARRSKISRLPGKSRGSTRSGSRQSSSSRKFSWTPPDRATQSTSASDSWPTNGCDPWPSPPPMDIVPSAPIS